MLWRWLKKMAYLQPFEHLDRVSGSPNMRSPHWSLTLNPRYPFFLTTAVLRTSNWHERKILGKVNGLGFHLRVDVSRILHNFHEIIDFFQIFTIFRSFSIALFWKTKSSVFKRTRTLSPACFQSHDLRMILIRASENLNFLLKTTCWLETFKKTDGTIQN